MKSDTLLSSFVLGSTRVSCFLLLSLAEFLGTTAVG